MISSKYRFFCEMEFPQDPAIWEQFARYFRIHADLLRSGPTKQQRIWAGSCGCGRIFEERG
jgi:hypothetical protein